MNNHAGDHDLYVVPRVELAMAYLFERFVNISPALFFYEFSKLR